MEKHHTDKEFGRKRRQTEIDCCNPYETKNTVDTFVAATLVRGILVGDLVGTTQVMIRF